jgi:hypothetical protein
MGIVAAACLLSSCSVRWRAPRCAIRANPFAFDQQLFLSAAGGDRRRPKFHASRTLRFSSAWISVCSRTSPRVYNLSAFRNRLFTAQERTARFRAMHCHLASHPRNGLQPRRIVATADRRAQQRIPMISSEKRHPAGRVMVCLTRARLHTTIRGWQRAVAARWWRVGRDTASAAIRVTCATRTSSVC